MITAGCHSEHNKSKATVSLFSSGMIVKPERTQRTAKQNKDLTQKPTKERGAPGVSGAGQKDYLFSGAFEALSNISGELGSKHILLEI